MADKYSELGILKDTLEDMDLFLREIESIVDILNSTEDEEERKECELRLAGLSQQLSNMSAKLGSTARKGSV